LRRHACALRTWSGSARSAAHLTTNFSSAFNGFAANAFTHIIFGPLPIAFAFNTQCRCDVVRIRFRNRAKLGVNTASGTTFVVLALLIATFAHGIWCRLWL
jgi:hypothetical protein